MKSQSSSKIRELIFFCHNRFFSQKIKINIGRIKKVFLRKIKNNLKCIPPKKHNLQCKYKLNIFKVEVSRDG